MAFVYFSTLFQALGPLLDFRIAKITRIFFFHDVEVALLDVLTGARCSTTC